MDNVLAEMERQVFARRPILKEIIKSHGELSVKDYVGKNWIMPKGISDEVFISIFIKEAAAIYGEQIAHEAASQLRQKPLVSTIDHLGICGHPFFVNSGVIYSLAFGQSETAIVLATESVSLNNASSRSASFIYHSSQNLEHISFLPDRLKNLPVFSAPAVNASDVTRFSNATKGRFDSLIEYLGLADTTAASLSTQAARVSSKFWQKVFPSAQKMLYLPLETLISKYLLSVLEDPEDFLYYLVQTKEGRRLWQKHFPDEHTFLFWGIDEKGRRQKLESLPEKREDVLKLIESKRIYPSSPLCFIVLLKAGVTCAGGFTQTTWLTNVKKKMLAMALETGKFNSEKISPIVTTNFAESSLAWFKFGESYVSPSMADLFLAKEDYYPKYRKISENITLGQSIELALPDIYRVVVPKIEQISAKDIEEVEKGRLTALAKLL